MKFKLAALAVVAVAVLAAGACSDDDTIVGPDPTATATPPAGTTATATPPVNATATPTPPVAPTPTPPQGTTRTVDVGPGNSMTFVDRVSSSSTSTINVGDTIQWVWAGTDFHSTTSGTCTATCTPDGTWDSGAATGITFSHTFTQAGTFPYFCIPHGAMMTGTVIVQ